MDSNGSSPLSLTQSWSQCKVEKFLSGNASHSHSRKPGMCVSSFATEVKSWNIVEVLKKLVKFLPQKYVNLSTKITVFMFMLVLRP